MLPGHRGKLGVQLHLAPAPGGVTPLGRLCSIGGYSADLFFKRFQGDLSGILVYYAPPSLDSLS